MYIFESTHKNLMPKYARFTAVINEPNVWAKLSDETKSKIENFKTMFKAYNSRVKFINGAYVYTGVSSKNDVFRGGKDKVTGALGLKRYLSDIERMIDSDLGLERKK